MYPFEDTNQLFDSMPTLEPKPTGASFDGFYQNIKGCLQDLINYLNDCCQILAQDCIANTRKDLERRQESLLANRSNQLECLETLLERVAREVAQTGASFQTASDTQHYCESLIKLVNDADYLVCKCVDAAYEWHLEPIDLIEPICNRIVVAVGSL